jgi:isopentenyl-diphosphate delta-isomerase
MVVLVDEADIVLGAAHRDTVHRRGILHRAVSVFIFNDRGEVLLQRRASMKTGFAGKWANTCCTHPRPYESVVAAGERRLKEEMGLLASLRAVGTFVYRAEDHRSGYVEHELDHVLVGRTDASPTLDPNEADDYRWLALDELRAVVTDEDYAPWLRHALDEFPRLAPIES